MHADKDNEQHKTVVAAAMLAKSATTIVSINEHYHLDDVTKLCFCVKGQLNCFEVCVCV